MLFKRGDDTSEKQAPSRAFSFARKKLSQTDQLRSSSHPLSFSIIHLRFLLLSSAGYPYRKLCKHNCQIPTKERLPGEARNSTQHIAFSSAQIALSLLQLTHIFPTNAPVSDYRISWVRPQLPWLGRLRKLRTLVNEIKEAGLV